MTSRVSAGAGLLPLPRYGHARDACVARTRVYGERERAVHLAATESHNCMYQ